MKKYYDLMKQFGKFSLVGISNTAISYISYLVFLFLGIYYIIASVLSFVLSVSNAFYWNNKYVFNEKESKKSNVVVAYVKCVMSYALTGLVLSNVLLIMWVEVLHVSAAIAPLLNLCITIPFNFLLNKYWTFR